MYLIYFGRLKSDKRVFFLLVIQYLPIEGLAAFNKATAELLLGADNAAIKENRVSDRFCVKLIGQYILRLLFSLIPLTTLAYLEFTWKAFHFISFS